MIREVKLSTKNMYEGMDPEDDDYQLWKKNRGHVKMYTGIRILRTEKIHW